MKHEALHDFYQKGKVLLIFSFLLNKWPEYHAAPPLSLNPKYVILTCPPSLSSHPIIFFEWILGFFFFFPKMGQSKS